MSSNHRRNTNSSTRTSSTQPTDISTLPTETTVRVNLLLLLFFDKKNFIKFDVTSKIVFTKFVEQRQVQMVVHSRKKH
ncbi:unnamed protein product [Arabidopsis halleri]